MIQVFLGNMTIKIQHVVFLGPNKTPHFQIAVPKAVQGKVGKTKIIKKLTGNQSTVARQASDLYQHHRRMFALLKGDVEGNIADLQAQALLKLEEFGLKPGDGNITAQVPQGFYAYPHLDDIETYFRAKESKDGLSDSDLLAKKALFESLPILLSQAPDIYFDNHPKGTRTKFKENILMDWNKLCLFFPDQPLINIDRAKAKEFMHSRLTKVKTTSVQREINTLRAIINVVKRERNLTFTNPFESLIIPNLKQDTVKKEPLTHEEHRRIIQACTLRSDEIRVMALLCALTGARIGEIAGLRVQDLHLNDETPHIEITTYADRTLKTTNSVRRVPLVQVGVTSIERLIKKGKTGITLFPSYANGEEVNNNNASAAVNKYLKTLGINKTIHSARHALRDLLRAADVPIDYAFEIGGWGSQSIGDKYGVGYSMRQKMDAMERALSPVLAETKENVD